MKHQPVALTRVRWLPAEEGGRTQPPAGPQYAATARFAGGQDETHFSVVLRFSSPPPGKQRVHEVKLSLLVPENLPEIGSRLVPQSRLYIHEGSRVVAEGEVLSVAMEDTSHN